MKKVVMVFAIVLVSVNCWAEDNVRVRGLFKSMDTANITYSTFSPYNGEDKERDGKNVNMKVRYRPVMINETRVGVYGTYTNGESNTMRRRDRRCSYADYEIIGGGVSVFSEHKDHVNSEIEAGLLYQETENRIPRKGFQSFQEELQLELRGKIASDNRRWKGKVWLPYWEVGMHYVKPFDVTYSDTKGNKDNAYDNQRFKLYGNVDVYDVYLGDANQWRLTPSFNTEVGYLWGKESGYIQGGPGAKFAWRGQELVDIKFLNPRLMFEENGSRIYDFIGTVKIDNLVRAVWANKVDDYRKKEEVTVIQ